jgi:3-deoxy-D-manno-octulosonate 8-phosphate phosphatase (KDO 8-P phosphatase)
VIPAARGRAGLNARLKRLRLLLMDVDGVLTDGKLYHLVDEKGELIELKGVDTQDGIALSWLAASGIQTGVISGRSSTGLEARARMLHMSHIVQGTLEKAEAFERILRETGIPAEQAGFVGDDLPDLPPMLRAGLAVAVANARPELKKRAHAVTERSGGSGALRELAEAILRAQGRWEAILDRYVKAG